MKFAITISLVFMLCELSLGLKSEICGETPGDHGYCVAHIVQVTYNPKENKCLYFVYGGCHGNNNRFDTVEKCEEMCLE